MKKFSGLDCRSRSVLSRIGVTFIAVLAFSPGLADDEDIVTGQEGTDASEDITVNTPLAPDANVSSLSGGTFQATATGVDAADGNDTVTSNATIEPTANADVFLISDPAESEARAESIGIKAGSGDDTVTSNALIDATAGVLGGYGDTQTVGDDDTDNTPSDQEEIDVSVTGTATASGIEGNAGDDTLTNNDSVITTATATIGGGAAPLEAQVTKELKISASSTSESTARGITGGAGSDVVTNAGPITSGADSTARTLAVGVASGDGMSETEIAVEANAGATATADGINTEGESAVTDNDVSFPLDEGGLSVSFERTIVTPAGDDTVTHDGVIDVTATSNASAGGASIAIDVDGSAGIATNATATATGTGISTGGGADTVTASDTIDASATATASGLSVGVSASGGANSKADADASSTADAQGIKTDSENTASTFTTTLLISDSALTTGVTYDATSDAGADTVSSTADITATAEANTRAAGVGVTIDGSASSELDAEATANAIGIGTGGGADEVTSDGTVDAIASADAVALSVAFGQDDGEKLKAEVEVTAGATATANAGGIVTDGGRARTLLDFDLTIGTDGLDSSFDGLLEAFFADDNILSNGAVTADATARTGAGGVTVAIDGAASAKLTATSTATAAGLDTGGGSDVISTTDSVTATAGAFSGALTVGFGQKTAEKAKPKVKVEAGSIANASATGIAADSGKTETAMASLIIDGAGLETAANFVETASDGNDAVAVGGDVTAGASANAGVVGGSVAIDGAANADIEAKATSKATGIETGGGDDSVVSGCDSAVPGNCLPGVAEEGQISASAVSRAAAVAAGVGVKTGDSSSSSTNVKAETVADATATGISTDGGVTSQSTGGDLSIQSDGLTFGFAQSSTAASGIDSVDNRYGVDAQATAATGEIAVAVTIKGTARATVDNTATARATAIDTGGAADAIVNDGTLTATSTANAASAAVSVSTTGAALANGGVLGAGTTATSSATGISSAGGNYEKSLQIDSFIGFDAINVDVDVVSTNDSIGADGDDSIVNRGAVTTTSTARAGEVVVGVTSKGIAATISGAAAESTAAAIESGNGDDVIDNEGALISTADAETFTANVAVAAKGLATAVNSVWDGGTKAEATATGIDADSGSNTQKTVQVDVTADSAQIVYDDTTLAASGDDEISNSGKIDTTATASVLNGNVAVTLTGVSAAASTAKSTAASTAIRGGDGDDGITNSGGLDSIATATAVTANVAVTNAGVAAAADAVWDGGTTAEATAIGIAGDGGTRSNTTRLAIGTEEFGFESTEVLASGSDRITNTNTGSINTVATAETVSLAVAGVVSSGVGVATATSTSDARATAIDAGAGDDVDDVFNAGRLTSNATSRAAAGSVSITNAGVALSGDSVWDGGTKANATARGIDLGGGGETLTNEGGIDATSTATAASAAVSVAIAGVAGATATSTGTADAAAIDASVGDDVDTIRNSGDLTVGATAAAAAASVGFTNTGASFVAGAVWDGGTTATAGARGIDVGDGADDIGNTGDITVITDAKAAEVGISIAVIGVAGAVATSTGEATSTAIDAGDGADDDIVTNSGHLIAEARAKAATATASVTSVGVAASADAVWDGGTTGQARARGIETGQGADDVNNSGDIDALADAKSASLAVSVAITGVAGATAKSTGLSDATAIDLGSGADSDTVVNTGDLTARADSLATAAAVSVTTAGGAGSVGAVWDGGTTADGRARGIDMGGGADSVHNEGSITSEASGTSASATVAVAVTGGAGAIGTSTALADASGIDASAGDDSDDIYSSGTITTNATALANTATVSVTSAGVAVTADNIWDGGTKATTRARGIETGLGADTVENHDVIASTAFSEAASASASVAIGGVAGAIATSTAEADSVGIDTGDGIDDDLVISVGDVAAYSDAIAASAAVSFSLAGVTGSLGSIWDGGTSAMSRSVGIETGGGADDAFSDGAVVADALATATSVSVAFTLEGVAGAIAAANAQADALGISAGTGDDQIETRGSITASSLANANTATLAAVKFGVSGSGNNSWDGGTRGEATASGISAGQGRDTINNSADIDATARVVSSSTGVSFTVGGVSLANSSASGLAEARAIDGGEDNDRIDNLGNLSALADTTSFAVSVAITGIGVGGGANSVWDGGTTTDAIARGIYGGAGDDVITSGATGPEPSTINATANSRAVSTTVSVTVGGVAGSISTSTANADAAGIDAGDGNDSVVNDSDVTGRAEATSDSVNVAVTGVGVALAADSFWNGGTKANAGAAGIAGGAGDDQLTNTRIVTADAHSDAQSVAVAATIGGFAGAVASSTSVANAAGMNGDSGDDSVTNEGEVYSRALSEAAGVSVTYSQFGGAVAGFDGGSRAQATALGLAGGEGVDSLLNASGAVVDVNSAAETTQTAVTLTLIGVAAADAQAEAVADAVALDGGAGDDVLLNEGVITQLTSANAKSRAIAVTPGAGLFISSAGAVGHASGTALAGGEGNDQVSNSGDVTLNSEARSIGQAISFTQAGAALSDASADAVADAIGVRGDEGTDVLSNSGTLAIHGLAETTARSISASLLGVAIAKANSTSTSTVSGMAGGEDDDVISNTESGVVDVLAVADVTATSVSVVVQGAAGGEAMTVTDVTATGLAGNAGDDQITNDGLVSVRGASLSSASGTSVSTTGFSSAKAGTKVATSATGLSGGSGADVIVNNGTVRVGPGEGDAAWMAKLSTSASSFGFAGDVNAESAAYARTTSVGIDGGEDGDVISNLGEIAVVANALSETTGGTLNIFGTSDAGGESGAFTLATGIIGGGGDDLIGTQESLSVTATSRLVQDGTSFAFGGSGEAGSALEAATDAIGISGGDGLDEIRTAGDITITADSVLVSKGGGTTIFGASSAAGQSGATTSAVGIDAGADDDIVESNADIVLTATSDLSLNNSSYTFGGSGAAGGELVASTGVDGILGGDGADRITNSGQITMSALSTLGSVGESEATFGGSSGGTTSGGKARATGVSGGSGDDVLENAGGAVIEISAATEVNTQSIAYTFGGGSGTEAVLTGKATSVGMTGDQGDDTLGNDGVIRVASRAALKSDGGSSSSIGGTTTTGKSVAGTRTVGMDGGDGDDLVSNTGFLEVRAETISESIGRSSAAVFVGKAVTGSDTEAVADAFGLVGGEGSNELISEGQIEVSAAATAYSLAYAKGASVSFNGDARARADSSARATATGIEAGDAANRVVNSDALNVLAEARTAKELVTTVTVYRLQGYADEETPPPAAARRARPATVDDLPAFTDDAIGNENKMMYPDGTIVFCVAAGCADASVVNSSGNYFQVDVVQVDPDGDGDEPPVDVFSWVPFVVVDDLPAFSEDEAGMANEELYPAGTVVACTAIACREDPSVNAAGTYYKVVVDDDTGQSSWALANDDGFFIEVNADIVEASFPSYAAANGNGADGDGRADSVGSAVSEARGIRLGHGDNVVENAGNLTVTARSEAAFATSADGDGLGDASGNSVATAEAFATGISLGDGSNDLLNTGDLTVLAAPSAQGLTKVTGGDICIWFFGWWCGGGGEGNGNSTTHFTADARGIVAGAGGNRITNDGDILVQSSPEVRIDDREGAFVAVVRGADNQTTTIDVVSRAVGIETGAGDDEIVNNGSVVVEARDLAGYCSPVNCLVEATGIVTGEGNDIVTNNGLVSAVVIRNGVTTDGLAIDLGPGDDWLQLGGDSAIVGNVDLGEGDNTLVLTGTPTLQASSGNLLTPLMGGGSASLMLLGSGAFANEMPAFDRVTKTAAGVYEVSGLAPVSALTIGGGAIAIGSSYTFAPDGEYSTYINTDETYGSLMVAGDVLVDGGITVERRGEDFIRGGTRYAVVDATGSVTGGFNDIVLPEARALLSFDLETRLQSVDVVAVAASFATVTANPVYQRIGVNLDTVASAATGDMADVLGTIQNLESGFDQAFASASPETHATATATSYAGGRQVAQFLQNHMGASRASFRRPGQTRGAAPGISWSMDNNGIGHFGFNSNKDLHYYSEPILLAANDSTYLAPKARRRASNRIQAWGMAELGRGDYDAVDGYTAFDADTSTAALGVDVRLGEHYVLGGLLGYADTSIDTKGVVSTVDLDGGYGGTYLSWFSDRAYVEGGITYADQSFDSVRELTVGTLQRTATSSHDGDAWMTFAGGGYEFWVNGWIVEPYGSLYYFRLTEDGFTETGADSLNQVVGRRKTDALFAEVGTNLVYRQLLDKSALDWHAKIGLNHDFDIDDASVTYGYEGAPGNTFELADRKLGQDSARLGAGVSWLTERMTLSLEYNGVYNPDYKVHGIAGQLNVRF